MGQGAAELSRSRSSAPTTGSSILVQRRERRATRPSRAGSARTGVLAGAAPLQEQAQRRDRASRERAPRGRTTSSISLGEHQRQRHPVADLDPHRARAEARARARRWTSGSTSSTSPTRSFGAAPSAVPARAAARRPLPQRSPPSSTNVTASISRPRLLRRARAHAVEGEPDRPRHPARLRGRHAQVGPGAALLVRQDLTTGFPRTTLKGAVGIYYEPPQPQETNAVFGQVGLSRNRATRIRRRDRAGVHAVRRCVDRRLLQGTRTTSIVTGSLQQRDAGTPSGSRRSSAGAPTGASSAGSRTRSRAACSRTAPAQPRVPEPVRPDAHPHGHRQLPPRQGVAGRRALPLRQRLPVHAEHATASTTRTTRRTSPQSAYPTEQRSGCRSFHELDIRVDKSWVFSKWQLSAYLDMQNVYNQGNVEGTELQLQLHAHVVRDRDPVPAELRPPGGVLTPMKRRTLTHSRPRDCRRRRRRRRVRAGGVHVVERHRARCASSRRAPTTTSRTRSRATR